GAQAMLYKLLSRADRNAFDPEVVSLECEGPMASKIAALDVPVRSLGLRSGRIEPRRFLQFVAWLRRSRFHLLQTWMYHADLVGGFAAKLAGRLPVVWSIRQSNLDPRHNKRPTLWIVSACARLSPWLPARIICCSEAAQKAHREVGYAADKMVVIPNGFDVDSFRPDPDARTAIRRELDVPESAVLVGHVARFDSQKDHQTFIRASRLLNGSGPEVHFVMCGDNIDAKNVALTEWIAEEGIGPRCHLLGMREDVARIHAALDVEVCSSVGEGFSNAVGEAMACGVPCVSTGVGDADTLIGDTGRVVPIRDPVALARGCEELIAIGPAGRARLGLAARKRIRERFSLDSVVARYESLYRELADVRH
ncbi:MAG TPA: glycosyltransferase, partial [Candidatus Binatia bacterium]|nr:glycosyltransferase [Candidatus Binatia bacterium]